MFHNRMVTSSSTLSDENKQQIKTSSNTSRNNTTFDNMGSFDDFQATMMDDALYEIERSNAERRLRLMFGTVAFGLLFSTHFILLYVSSSAHIQRIEENEKNVIQEQQYKDQVGLRRYLQNDSSSTTQQAKPMSSTTNNQYNTTSMDKQTQHLQNELHRNSTRCDYDDWNNSFVKYKIDLC